MEVTVLAKGMLKCLVYSKSRRNGFGLLFPLREVCELGDVWALSSQRWWYLKTETAQFIKTETVVLFFVFFVVCYGTLFWCDVSILRNVTCTQGCIE